MDSNMVVVIYGFSELWSQNRIEKSKFGSWCIWTESEGTLVNKTKRWNKNEGVLEPKIKIGDFVIGKCS